MNIRWLVLFAAVPVVASAQAYKWRDSHGVLHYSQTPPSTGAYEVIGTPPPPAAAPNQDALQRSLEKDLKDAPERQQAAEKAAAAEAKRQEACRAAVERIAYLDARTPRRLGVTNPDGSSSRMTQEEFDRQRADEQAKVDKNC